MKYTIFSLYIILTFSFFGHGQSNSVQKITAEEIVTKHLASIGTTQDLATIKSRVMVGTSKFMPRVGDDSNLKGVSQFASEGDKVLFAMLFDVTNSYLYEKASYDGNNLTIGLPLGKRTLLGDFLRAQSVIFKDGLIGGTLSSNWVLFNLNAKKGKIEFDGTEKIDNREFYKLKYTSSNSGRLRTTFYFDVTNFHHTISKYEIVIAPRMLSDPTAAVRQREIRYTLIEQFNNFKTVGKLTLPFVYSLDLTVQSDAPVRQNWLMEFEQVYYNEQLDASAFKVS